LRGPNAQSFDARFGRDISRATFPKQSTGGKREKGFLDPTRPSGERLFFVNGFPRGAFAEMDCAGGERD